MPPGRGRSFSSQGNKIRVARARSELHALGHAAHARFKDVRRDPTRRPRRGARAKSRASSSSRRRQRPSVEKRQHPNPKSNNDLRLRDAPRVRDDALAARALSRRIVAASSLAA